MHHNVLDTRLVKNELNPKHSIHHFSPLHSEVKLYRFAAKHSTKIPTLKERTTIFFSL